ncbi:Protein DGCR6 isoform 1 [Schistosoma japonicum]|uniref:Protein DGCR6 isoform 1 n=1 Tax=Schistosoma japonicum TaxID=6182 RepID=A0A4Z2DKH1_SCHJA|nr:Protein DGCR6 isoform 1 [Schistosoma japonicum]
MSFQPPIYYPTDLSDLHQSTTTTSVEEDHVDKEYFQQKVYYYLNELRCFVHQAPFDIQTGISEDMIAQLAHILAEGKIFLTVSELVNSQRIEEQILHKQLIDLRSEQSACRSTLRRKHREEISMNSSRPHHLPVLHKEHEQEMQIYCQKHHFRRLKIQGVISHQDPLVVNFECTSFNQKSIRCFT